MSALLCVLCPSKPKQIEHGLVCFGCSNRLLRLLRELEEYLPTLSLLKGSAGMGEYSPPQFGSKTPANDTVIHHTDWRSQWDALDGLGAVATIHSWARAVREDREFHPPKYVTLTSEVSALRANHDWIICQPFVDEYATELREVHAAVRAAAHDPIPRSVGRCISVGQRGECGGAVYELDDASGVRCSVCRRIYTGLDCARFHAAQESGLDGA